MGGNDRPGDDCPRSDRAGDVCLDALADCTRLILGMLNDQDV